MTDAPLVRLLLFAILVVAAVSLVRTPRGSAPAFAMSLNTPHLSLSVTL